MMTFNPTCMMMMSNEQCSLSIEHDDEDEEDDDEDEVDEDDENSNHVSFEIQILTLMKCESVDFEMYAGRWRFV